MLVIVEYDFNTIGITIRNTDITSQLYIVSLNNILQYVIPQFFPIRFFTIPICIIFIVK